MNVKELFAYGPHRPPMVWIDEVVSGTEALVNIRADGLYMGPRGLRPSACIEFIAQAYGYTSLYAQLQSPGGVKPLRKAYLAAIKDAAYFGDFKNVNAGTRLKIQIESVRHMGPLALVEGAVYRDDMKLASTQLKVYSET